MQKERNLIKKLVSKKEVSQLLAQIEVETGCPLAVRDVAGHVLYGSPERHSFTPKQAQPVLIDGRPAAYVYGQKGAFTVAGLLSLLARNEVEKKALGRETLAKYKEISLLYEIAEKLAENLEPGEAARLVIEEAGRLVKAAYICLKVVGQGGGTVRLAQHGEYSDAGQDIRHLVEEVEANVLSAGRPEILNGLPSGTGGFSLMCVPLKVKEKVTGVITMACSCPAGYSAEDLKIVSALAFWAAAVIENAALYDSLKQAFLTTADTLAEAVDKRDPYTGGHARRVMEYSLAIGREMGLEGEDLESLRLAAVLHDIGKIGIGDSILLKDGKLTKEEFEAIKMHPLFGEEILKHVEYFKNIIPAIKHHHERFNGGGYPLGLKGENIGLAARIIAVADAFDAMTSERRYRKALSPDEAAAELAANAGTQFDPAVVQAFLRIYPFLKISE